MNNTSEAGKYPEEDSPVPDYPEYPYRDVWIRIIG